MQDFDSKIRKNESSKFREPKSQEDSLCELIEKIQSFTADELEEFIRLASQALNRPID